LSKLENKQRNRNLNYFLIFNVWFCNTTVDFCRTVKTDDFFDH